MADHVHDERTDRELRGFLEARAADLRGITGAAEMAAAIGRGGTVTRRGPALRPTLLVAAALLVGLVLATAALVGARLDRPLPATVLPSPTPLDERAWERINLEVAAPLVVRVVGGVVVADVDRFHVTADGRTWQTRPADEWHVGLDNSSSSPRSWASWQNQVASWNDRKVLVTEFPDASIVRDFTPELVTAVGVGPRGVVVATVLNAAFNHLAFIGRVLGPEWTEGIDGIDFRDEVMLLRYADGRTAEIRLAEHGITARDIRGGSAGWHTVDGRNWALIEEFPDAMEALVGTPEGFIGRDGGGRMWHSPDGMAWRSIGLAYPPNTAHTSELRLIPFGAGAIETNGVDRFDLWTSSGKSVTPSVRLPGWAASGEGWSLTIGAGPSGLVALDHDLDQVAFSSDGIAWEVRPMPADLALADGSARGRRPTVTVGDGFVVALVWDQPTERQPAIPTLWRGVPPP